MFAAAAEEEGAVAEGAATLRLGGMMIHLRRHRRNRLESVLLPLLSKKGMVSSWPLCASMFSPHLTRLAPADFQFVENWRDFHVYARYCAHSLHARDEKGTAKPQHLLGSALKVFDLKIRSYSWRRHT
jgi:hypothetical protein